MGADMVFYRAGARHQVFVAYCVHGHQFVGLLIHTHMDIWSGWHGAWKYNGDMLAVALFYQEKICLFKFRHVVGHFYMMLEILSGSTHTSRCCRCYKIRSPTSRVGPGRSSAPGRSITEVYARSTIKTLVCCPCCEKCSRETFEKRLGICLM